MVNNSWWGLKENFQRNIRSYKHFTIVSNPGIQAVIPELDGGTWLMVDCLKYQQ